jgi:hypothetical protein
LWRYKDVRPVPQPNSRKLEVEVEAEAEGDGNGNGNAGVVGCRRLGKMLMKVVVDFHMLMPVNALELPTVSSNKGVWRRRMGEGKAK